MNPLNESWLPVVGFEDCYEVSNHGRVRSIPRVVHKSNGRTQTVPARILAQCLDSGGYPSINRRRVHDLVLQAFVGPRPPGHECCHRDDNRRNNVVPNLYWGTHSDNMLDIVKNGRHVNANKTHCKRGHEFNAENTYVGERGVRQCRPCKNHVRQDRPSEGCSVPGSLRMLP